MSRLDYLKYARRIFIKRGMPLYIVFFVTERCNARCAHCLCGSGPTRTNDLTLEEIQRIAEGMDDFLFLLLTGGEPFLRDDLPEIARTFYEQNSVKNMVMCTNGSMPEKVAETAERILDLCPGMDLGIDVSIDGIGEEHDRVRGVPGLFEKTVRTYRLLREMEAKRPNFNCNVEVTVSTFNQDRLMELYGYLKRELGVSTVFNLLTRGAPRDPVARGVKIEKYLEFNRAIADDIRRNVLSGYYSFPFADWINAKRAVRFRIISRIVTERRWILPCTAANLGCILRSDGDVYPCELLDMRMGNLREEDYDFRKIWWSERAEEIRRHIKKTRCFCTYECFLTNNILFNPRIFPLLFWKWLQIKTGRLMSRWRYRKQCANSDEA